MGLSGADLEYQRMLAEADILPANAQGYDGPLLEQIGDTAGSESLKVSVSDRPVSLYDRAGIYFDGVTTTSAATLQAILNTCAGKKIDIGAGGVLILDGPITLPSNCTLEGNTQFFGSGLTATTEIRFPTLTGVQVGVTLGAGARIKDILLRGPGFTSTCIGLVNTDSQIFLEGVQFYEWGTGTKLTDVYYPRLLNCEWRFNTVGVEHVNCTNTTYINPKFSCRNTANTVFGTAIKNGASSPIQPLSIFGGSIESYGGTGGTVAGIVLGTGSIVNLYGTYFESPCVGAIGITPGNNSQLNLHGCIVSLQEADRFVNGFSQTGLKVYARGNQFNCNSGSSTTPIAYVLGTGVEFDVDDDIRGLEKGSYVSSTAVAKHTYPSVTGNPPVGNTKNYGHSISVAPTETLRTGRAATGSRPNAATVGAGSEFYDTTLNVPIWSNGSSWTTPKPRYNEIDVVLDHGADKTGATSSVAAFEAALAAANALGGKVNIIVPPGTYDLTAGLTTIITTSQVFIVGAGVAVTRLIVTNGTLFQWGNNVGTILGGGLRDCNIANLTSPASNQRVAYINGGSAQHFSNILLENVRQLAKLGEPGAGTSSSARFTDIYGNTDPAAGSIVVDAAHGYSLSMSHIVLSSRAVGYPTDGITLHPANDTTFLRFGQALWDTAHCYEVITNRYNRGIDMNVESAVNLGNMWFNSCVFDYNKTNGIRIRTNHAGGGIRSIFFVSGWAVGSDEHSVEVACTLGTIRTISFSQFTGRQAGKNNWKFSGGGSMENVTLVDCIGMGANRLSSTNTGTDQDDLVILSSGVSVLGGRFGEDGQPYTGITPNQGRYGVTVAPDLSVYAVTNATLNGVTGAASIPATNAAGNTRRLIHNNRFATVAGPAILNYATTSAVVAPASTATQTHTGATVDTLYIYGGTVTSIVHNGTEIGTTGPATLVLNPGDTWQITYSVAPTIKRIVSP